MNFRRLYRFALMAASGGFLLQATSCKTQAMDTLFSTVVPALTSALTDAITAAITNGLAT